MDGAEKTAVRDLITGLIAAQQLRNRPRIKLVKTKFAVDTVAAGIGDFADWGQELEDIYLHDSRTAQRTDLVFKVNGNSMEPDFPNGSYVSVTVASGCNIYPGQIGIFSVDNELYIKEFQRDGLHSHNPSYPPMLFHSHRTACLIGVVNGVIPKSDIATPAEIADFRAAQA